MGLMQMRRLDAWVRFSLSFFRLALVGIVACETRNVQKRTGKRNASYTGRKITVLSCTWIGRPSQFGRGPIVVSNHLGKSLRLPLATLLESHTLPLEW